VIFAAVHTKWKPLDSLQQVLEKMTGRRRRRRRRARYSASEENEQRRLEVYATYMVSMMETLGKASPASLNLTSVATRVLLFDKELAEVSMWAESVIRSAELSGDRALNELSRTPDSIARHEHEPFRSGAARALSPKLHEWIAISWLAALTWSLNYLTWFLNCS